MSYLLTFLKLDFQKFVNGFLVVESVHDGQVDNSAQINQVGFSPVLDSFLGFRN